jgi:hypothetical protein
MQFPKLSISAATVGAVAFLCFPFALNAKAIDKPGKYFVRFAAISTAVHSTWFGSQDVYLVELKSGRRGTPFLAKLVDEYPDYEGALPRPLLTSNGRLLIRVRRDFSCDVRYGNMPKRAAPEDQLAVFREPKKFAPNLQAPVADDFVVPCYRLFRK